MSEEGVAGLPEGWARVALGKICDIQAGGPALRKKDHVRAGVPVIRPGDLRHRRVSAHTVAHLDPEHARGLFRYRLAAGDILVTRTGTVGRAALVTEGESGWLYNTHLLRVRAHDPSQAPYLLAFLADRRVVDWLERRAAGTTGMRSVGVRTLKDLPVSLPPLDRQRDIGAALNAVDEKLRVHEEIVRTTTELRETLAELLMTDRMPRPRSFGTGEAGSSRTT
ncbi:restriction endonuclease subunit S [Streptomyces sp. NPDC014983]|uniref:restriction endonuclease subunit S n=1 Tax=Streptomyces sp. NPDC014983 TaxID=3364933 RepID=UPI0036F7D47F